MQNTEHRHSTQDTNTAYNRPPVSFISMQFSAKFWQKIGWRNPPPPVGPGAHVWEIVDPTQTTDSDLISFA